MTQIDKIEIEVARLRDQCNRLVADQISEKEVRVDRHTGFDNILHGKGGDPGLIVRIDRVEQELGRIKENRKHIIALWIAILVMILREIINSIGSP